MISSYSFATCLTPPLPTVASTYSNFFLIQGPQDHLVYPKPSPWQPRLTRKGHMSRFPLKSWEAGRQSPLLLAFVHVYLRTPSSGDSHPLATSSPETVAENSRTYGLGFWLRLFTGLPKYSNSRVKGVCIGEQLVRRYKAAFTFQLYHTLLLRSIKGFHIYYLTCLRSLSESQHFYIGGKKEFRTREIKSYLRLDSSNNEHVKGRIISNSSLNHLHFHTISTWPRNK